MYKVVSVIYIINCFIFNAKCWKQNQRLKTPLYAVPLDICNIKFSELTMLIYWFRSFWPVLWVASIAGKSIFLSMDLGRPCNFLSGGSFAYFRWAQYAAYYMAQMNELLAGWLADLSWLTDTRAILIVRQLEPESCAMWQQKKKKGGLCLCCWWLGAAAGARAPSAVS